MKVLVADDDRTCRRMLEALVRRLGFDVLSVADGEQALAALTGTEAPKIAILDWVMPQLDGPGVCRALRSGGGQDYTYVILLTSRAEERFLIIGLESGADDYMTKPVSGNELRARLRVGQRIVTLQQDLIASREELRRKAAHDPLTGLLNRGAIMPAIERDIARARRERVPLSVVMLDLDHFKRINDTFGHPVGDAVLQEAARRIELSMRASDAVGRVGGEEFLVSLPSCDLSSAKVVADRIRACVGNRPVPTDATQVSVSCSAGVATFEPNACPEDAPEDAADLIARADAALLRAKREGRDRVCCSQLGAGMATRDLVGGRQAEVVH